MQEEKEMLSTSSLCFGAGLVFNFSETMVNDS